MWLYKEKLQKEVFNLCLKKHYLFSWRYWLWPAQAGLTLNSAGDSKAADAGFAPIITVMIVLLTGAAATVLFLWLRKRTPRLALAGKDKPRTKIYMPRDMQPDLGEEDDDE